MTRDPLAELQAALDDDFRESAKLRARRNAAGRGCDRAMRVEARATLADLADGYDPSEVPDGLTRAIRAVGRHRLAQRVKWTLAWFALVFVACGGVLLIL